MSNYQLPRIEIHSIELETRNKRNSTATYQVQQGFIHTVSPDGEPNRYPDRFWFFPPRDQKGEQVIALPKGDYWLNPSCIRVSNGFLDLAFPRFIPAKKV